MWDFCRLIWWALVGLFRSRRALEAEILVLRQQINVLRRTAPKRLLLSSIDPLIFVGLYRLFPDVRGIIEHRLFSFITQNWRGRPLVSHQAIVQLIAATTTDTGLKVRCELDPKIYPAGVKITDSEMDAINTLRHKFRGGWNYTIRAQVEIRSDSS
jgi:DDE family transposase